MVVPSPGVLSAFISPPWALMMAALDTFDDEPLPDDSAFYTLNNVTITPHIAGSTIDAFSNSPKLFAEILLKKLS